MSRDDRPDPIKREELERTAAAFAPYLSKPHRWDNLFDRFEVSSEKLARIAEHTRSQVGQPISKDKS